MTDTTKCKPGKHKFLPLPSVDKVIRTIYCEHCGECVKVPRGDVENK